MIRQQKRKELRDIAKSLIKAKNTKEFKDTQLYFDSIKKEDLKLLQENTHPDPKAQELYKRYLANMKYLIALKTRQELLLGVKHK